MLAAGVFTHVSALARVGRALLIALLLLMVSWAALAELPVTRHFTRLSEADGLPRDHVMAVVQDRQGFIWIGTQAGLSRYDGYRLVSYRAAPDQPRSLADSWVQTLLVDPQGTIWIGTRRGLQKYVHETDDFETVALPRPGRDAQAASQVNALAWDAEGGTLWVGTHHGLFQVKLLSGSIRGHFHEAGRQGALSHDRVSALHLDASGLLWVGSEAGVDVLDSAREQFKPWRAPASTKPVLGLERIQNLLLDKMGVLWVSSAAGLQAWALDPNRQPLERLHAVSRHVNDAFIVPYEDRSGQVWLGTETSGLGRWDLEKRRFVFQQQQDDDAHGVPRHISTLYQDRSGSLWVGTWASGVYRTDLESGGFSKYGVLANRQGLKDSRVFSVASNGAGKLWLSTYEDVTLLDPGTGQKQTIHLGATEDELGNLNLADARINAQDEAARRWISLYADPQTGRLKLPVLDRGRVLSNVVRHVVSGRDGQIWLGSRSGVHRLDPKTGATRSYHHDPRQARSLSDDEARYILVDREGDVWVANDQGLDRYDAARDDFVRIGGASSASRGLRSNRMQYLHQDRQGRIWAGTGEGLVRVEKRADGSVQFHAVPGQRGAAVDPIGGILEDDRGDLWISSTSGITRLNPETLAMQHYTSRDGMIEGFYFAQSAFKDEAGRMFFGGLNGLTGFLPERIKVNPNPPELVLTDIRVNNEALQPGLKRQGIHLQDAISMLPGLTLGHQHKSLILEFAALHYADPHANAYRYKLEGYDKDWIAGNARNRIASYANLPPNKYVFRVQAANKDGVWGQGELALDIEVKAAYWQKAWFVVLVLMLASALLWLGLRWRLRSLTQQQEQLEAVIAGRTAELRKQKELLEQAHGHISQLSVAGRRITSTLDITDIHEALHREVTALLPLDGFALGIHDEASGDLVFPRVWTAQGETSARYVSGVDADRQEMRCLAQKGCALLEAPSQAPLSLVGGLACSAMLAPLAVEGRRLGLLVVQTVQPQRYEPWQCDLLSTLAAYCAIALENAKTVQQLRHTQNELVQQQKFAALGSLVAGVAHELNTPLGISLTVASTMQGRAEAFAGRLKGEQPLRKSDLSAFLADMNEGADLLMRSLTKGTELVASFKEVAVDRASAKRREFELHRVAQDVAETLANDIKVKGHELHVEVPAGIRMDSYPGPLGQVLTNLIHNAMLHGFDGRRGGHMHLSASQPKPGQVRLSFRDDGKGIEPRHLARIFDPFFTTKLGQGGSGLGLSICFNMVRSVLGGEISVSSEVGKGSCFTLDLPLQAPEQQGEDPYL